MTVSQRDVSGRVRPETTVVEQAGEPGADLRLTIDASLQLKLEQELLAAYIADEAKSVSALVMDPYTGEVYAEASFPSYDANDYRAVATTDPSRFLDPVVSHVYEPGRSRDDYINRSGGLSQRADKKRIYVVRANGEVVANNGGGWFQRDAGSEIRPGDAIVVPLDVGQPLARWGAIAQIIYPMALAAAAVNSF